MKALHAWIERYFPCSFERGGSLLVVIGVVSTLVYVYTRIAFKDELRELPQNLMVLTFLVSAWGQRHQLTSDFIFRLLVLAALIPWVLFAVNALIDYETALKYRSTNDLLKLFLFLPLAWWMGGSRAGAIRILALAFLGLMTAVALDPSLTHSLGKLWQGKRVDFDIYNAQHGALFFGLVILFCSCVLAQRVSNGLELNRGNVLLFFVGLVGLAGVVGTQTRAAFLGLFACGFVAFVQAIRQASSAGRKHRSIAAGAVVLLVVTGLLAWSAQEVLQKRFDREKSTFNLLLTGNLEEMPFQGTGMRIHSWAEALQWIAERPVTGWGQKARSDVIQLAERFPDEIKNAGYGHLHNGYLEILIGVGAVGLVFVCVLWVVLARRIKLAASHDLFAFAFYGSIFFLVLNLFESFFIYSSGEFALALFMAGGYSQYLARSLGPRAQQQPDPGRMKATEQGA